VKLFFLFLLPYILLAHQSGLSFIKLHEHPNHTVDVIYKMPLQDLYANPITINYPSNCIKTLQKPKETREGFVIEKYTLTCAQNGLFGRRIWIEGLIKQNRGVMVEYSDSNHHISSLLRAQTPFVSIRAKSSSLALFEEYLKLGVHHILSGYDHLLFVLCLLLLAKNIKALLLAVTAFTLAHSITLACAMLGIITLPVAFIEAMIALSILFLARELVQTQQDTLTKRHLEVIAFIFGLLHGFGFSNVLKTIGLAKSSLALSLFSFNLGIEIGQILFIVGVSAFYLVVKKALRRPLPKIKISIAYFVGTLSAFWFIQRVLGF
jgi:hydrogenase/urease accessory protein HupE